MQLTALSYEQYNGGRPGSFKGTYQRVMIDSFHNLAVRLRPLLSTTIALSVVFVLAAAAIVVLADSPAQDRYLMPSVVGVLWSLSAYAFIATFQHVPSKISARDGWLTGAGRRLQRGWYWLLALVFLGTTGVALFVTVRLATIWFRDY